jgi:hypothetical protein
VQTWEYLILRFSIHHFQWMVGESFLGREEDLSNIVNKLGSEGWEMVNANGTSNISCMAFKRPLPIEIKQAIIMGDGHSDESPAKPRRGRPPKVK